jgi:Ca2+-transporting ATPase
VKSFILRAVFIAIPVYYWIFLSRSDDLEYARTMLFFMFVGVELVVALNCRSLVFSLFSVPPHKWLVIAIAWELLLIAVIIQFPAVRHAFGITTPTLADLGLIAAVGLMMMMAIEIAKVLLRRHRRNATPTG